MLQSSKIFVDSKLRAYHKAAEQRKISHKKVFIFYRTPKLKNSEKKSKRNSGNPSTTQLGLLIYDYCLLVK